MKLLLDGFYSLHFVTDVAVSVFELLLWSSCLRFLLLRHGSPHAQPLFIHAFLLLLQFLLDLFRVLSQLVDSFVGVAVRTFHVLVLRREVVLWKRLHEFCITKRFVLCLPSNALWSLLFLAQICLLPDVGSAHALGELFLLRRRIIHVHIVCSRCFFERICSMASKGIQATLLALALGCFAFLFAVGTWYTICLCKFKIRVLEISLSLEFLTKWYLLEVTFILKLI